MRTAAMPALAEYTHHVYTRDGFVLDVVVRAYADGYRATLLLNGCVARQHYRRRSLRGALRWGFSQADQLLHLFGLAPLRLPLEPILAAAERQLAA